MTDKEYKQCAEFAIHYGQLMAVNIPANEILWNGEEGEIITMKEIKPRDIAFHRCYFVLITYIWHCLPTKFHKQVPLENFHNWLKHLQGNYKVLFEFKDGTKLVEYDSIAFGKMNQGQFETYVREQLPWIYEDVIRKMCGKETDKVIEDIENKFKKFLSKL